MLLLSKVIGQIISPCRTPQLHKNACGDTSVSDNYQVTQETVYVLIELVYRRNVFERDVIYYISLRAIKL